MALFPALIPAETIEFSFAGFRDHIPLSWTVGPVRDRHLQQASFDQWHHVTAVVVRRLSQACAASSKSWRRHCPTLAARRMRVRRRAWAPDLGTWALDLGTWARGSVPPLVPTVPDGTERASSSEKLNGKVTLTSPGVISNTGIGLWASRLVVSISSMPRPHASICPDRKKAFAMFGFLGFVNARVIEPSGVALLSWFVSRY